MYIYNVTVRVDTHRSEEWIKWMIAIHIPEVMQTGYFTDYRVCHILDDTDSEGETFAVQYTFRAMEEFTQYRATNAPALQKAAADKFGDHFVAFRTLMEVID